MAAKVSEAFVLRTYPFREADLIVSFFSRSEGRLKGSAFGARKPKSRFGASLERLSLVRVHYTEKANRDLVTLTSCDLVFSQFPLAQEYGSSVALDFFAEVSEHLLPPHEPNERFFRLLVAVIDHLHADRVHNAWPAITYFAFWAVRLSGFLPELHGVGQVGQDLAAEMAVTPIAQLAPREWTKQYASDLRGFLIHQIELQIERRLLTVPILATV